MSFVPSSYKPSYLLLFLLLSVSWAGPILRSNEHDVLLMIRTFGDDLWYDELESGPGAAMRRRSKFSKPFKASSNLKPASRSSASPPGHVMPPTKSGGTTKTTAKQFAEYSDTKPRKSYADAVKSEPPDEKKKKTHSPGTLANANTNPKTQANSAKPVTPAEEKGHAKMGKPSSSAIKSGKSYADAVKQGLPVDKTKSRSTPGGTKPRCKPGQKSKRGLYEDCEEYDPNNVKPLTNQDATPNVKNDNPTKWWGSAKYTYNDNLKRPQDHLMLEGKRGGRKVNQETVDNIGHSQVNAQKDYYASPGAKPYSKPPGALGVNVDPDAEGPGIHGIRISTSMTTRHGTPAPAPASVLHPSVDALRPGKDKKPRRGTKNSGAHTEEVNGSQRAYEGQKPFEGTTHATYEVHGPKGQTVEPMRACKANCRPLLDAGGGTDLHRDVAPTKHQREAAERKKQRIADAKAAESGPSSNSAQSSNTNQPSGSKGKNVDTEDTASSKRKPSKNDASTPNDYQRWSDRTKLQDYTHKEQLSDESLSSLPSDPSSSDFDMFRKRGELTFVRRWLEEVILEPDFDFDF